MGFDAKVWVVILAVGLGTYLIRWSFLGALGERAIPAWARRALRYTAVGVLPAILAPLTLWPAATGGQPDPARLTAAAVTVLTGVVTRNVLAAILAGMASLFTMLWLLG